MGGNLPLRVNLSTSCRRVLIEEAPFRTLDAGRPWIGQGVWPCCWITHPDLPTAPCWLEFQLKVMIAGPDPRCIRIHVTADERYEFFVDGKTAGWGSERGTIDHWYFDSYDLTLSPGEHRLGAKVRAAGRHALRSQMTVGPAFLLAAEVPGFSTGEAAWEVRLLDGLGYEKPFDHDFFSIGWNSVHDAARITHAELHAPWAAAWSLHPGSTAGRRNRYPNIHLLAPATLPVAAREPFAGGRIRHLSPHVEVPLLDADHLAEEVPAWQSWWLGGETLRLPPRQQRRLLVDLEDYVCAWPWLELSGGRGAHVQLRWAESLYETGAPGRKGDRAAIGGKTFLGVGDTFLPDGGARVFHGPFIRAGRYLCVTVSTGDEALVLEKLRLFRAEYPLGINADFTADFAPLGPLLERCRRTVRASCHDNLIDGPYYEQMGWIGDTPQVALTLYSLSQDDRLVRKVLEVFDRSRLAGGMIRARWPARDSLFIPPYSLCWINVLHDFAWWRDGPDFVRTRLPGMRAMLDGFLAWVDPLDGLLRIPMGWNFADWVPGWPDGIPPRDPDHAGAVFQWHLAWTFRQAATLEEQFGEPELAARFGRHAARIAHSADVFWDEARGLYADTRARTSHSEHAQAYAALSGLIPADRLARLKIALVADPALTRATDPFCHFVFEAYVRLGLREHVWPRMRRWFNYDALGLLTTPEAPEPTRSDCHAWGAHAHYHLYASILGLRPSAWGFRRVRIEPQWELLRNVAGHLPHPKGEIRFRLSFEDGRARGEITLPPGLAGELILPQGDLPLSEGENSFARGCRGAAN